MNNYQAEKLTSTWLKDNGMDETSFTVIELLFIQAQQVAFALMKYHADLLDKEQTTLLSNYLKDIKHRAKRNKITKKTVYRVLNLGTKVNRQLFKAHKAIKNSR